MRPSTIQKFVPVASLRERVGESLSAAIISGEIAPGTLISVPALAAQFAVSATPVREAMIDLEQRGFVRSERNKGFRVTEVSQEDLREIVEVRQLLEPASMRRLVARFPRQTLPEWRTIAERIVEHAELGQIPEFLEADRDFHLGLLALGGNARLVSMVRELRSLTRMVNLTEMAQSAELVVSAKEHLLMLDLIEAGKGEALEELVTEHLTHVLLWWSDARARH